MSMVGHAIGVSSMTSVARYLSSEWIARLSQSVASAAPDELTEPVVIQHVITDAPAQVADSDGEVTYHLRLSPTGSSAASGRAADPTVTFTQTYETAMAIATGASGAQAAFMGGDLRIGGQVDALVRNQPVFAGLDDLLAPLRADTEF